jgi:hypothetical protein
MCEGCADTDWRRYWLWSQLIVANICTRLKRIIRLQRRKPVWVVEKLQAQQQKVQESLEEKLYAGDCMNRNVEGQ